MITNVALAALLDSQTEELILLTAPAGSLPRAARAKLAEKIAPPVEVELPIETASEKRARLLRQPEPLLATRLRRLPRLCFA
jgi:hypothetical protein